VVKPAVTVNEQRARASDNMIEGQYRNKLNIQFDRLSTDLLDLRADNDRDEAILVIIKAEELEAAKRRTKSIEGKCEALRRSVVNARCEVYSG
jgi:hypothetical protein